MYVTVFAVCRLVAEVPERAVNFFEVVCMYEAFYEADRTVLYYMHNQEA